MLPKILKNFNLIIEGVGYAGRVDDLTLPKLTLKTEEYQLGGLDAPIPMDMGLEKLECEFTLLEYDIEVIKHFGLSTARDSTAHLTKLKFKGGLTNEGGLVVPINIELSGSWQSLDFGTWKVGDKSTLKVKIYVRYYKLTIDTEALIEIDIDNMTRNINGIEQLAALQ